MVDVIGGVTSALTAIELAKSVKAAVDKMGDATAKIQMAELYSTLADVKMEAALQLGRIAELEQQLSLKEQVVYERPYYFIQKNDNDRDGPYCQPCYDSEQNTIRLQGGKNGEWRCYICKGKFRDRSYVAPSRGLRMGNV